MHSTFLPTAYTVGWICVKVDNEAVAARAMLDERHGYIDLSGQGDPIQYFGGRIGKHNVIIGCSGEAGLNPANNVATNMSRSFKNIKVGFLCGIGGGNPSEKHDIRLGDVVVGMPEGRHSGVTQYNAGKTTEDGFLRKASHNRPPQFLIQAVGSRRTDLIEGLDTWKKHLDSAPKNWGSFDTLTDILHEGQHELPRPDNRESKVHYGLIASGDLVVKADKSRRELVQEIQDDVLCFEMEAAGLVNTFPCLVVRGISDYCDRYKNDDWQPYASSAAAAYCKYLLEVVHVSDVQVAATAAEIMKSDTHQVPFSLKGMPVVDHFVPRVKDMQKLESFFFTGKADLNRRKMFVVHGLGGIGKTQLCIEFIRRQQEKYSAVFWLDGSSEDALRRSFTDVVTRLPAAEVPLALAQAAEQASPNYRLIVQGVLDWLSLPSNRRWLLVIDNVDRDHTATVKDPLAYDVKQYLPAADHGSMLVTSRLSTLTAPRNSLRLTEVDHDQARAMLEATGVETMLGQDEHSVDALLEKLSGLPLALTQAAAYIGQTGVSIVQYLEYYDTMWKDLMEQQDEYPLQEYAERSVLTTWRLSYEQVKRQNEEASNLLQLWSFLYAGDLCTAHQVLVSGG
ncbi:hypothetical protein E4T50_16445 [Aureobasidium sp. EXF-12298]|nr:hypothetical protein E4T50_16445 [Aureobasidium sp. EXF-12298]